MCWAKLTEISSYPHVSVITYRLDGPPWKAPTPVLEYSNSTDGVVYSPLDSFGPVPPCSDKLDPANDNTVKVTALAADTEYPADYLNQKADWIKDLQEDNPILTLPMQIGLPINQLNPTGIAYWVNGWGSAQMVRWSWLMAKSCSWIDVDWSLLIMWQ